MSDLHFHPDPETFRQRAAGHNLVAVAAELTADFETPVSAYLKLRDPSGSFLFETAEMTESVGRYSILGTRPMRVLCAKNERIEVTGPDGSVERERKGDILTELQALMSPFHPAPAPDIPVFHGGAAGYLSFDAIRHFEPSVGQPPPDDLKLPDAVFFLMKDVVIFDQRLRKIILVSNAEIKPDGDPDAAREEACERIRDMFETLRKPHESLTAPLRSRTTAPTEFHSNTTREEYEGMVLAAKEYIKAGDVFQVVPSQRLAAPYAGDPMSLYRALRLINPSPYMFCMDFPQGFSLVGSSPEVNVTLQGDDIRIRPIAGTRWRGGTPEEDDALAAELLADPKELAEHVMLVDLARNDVGRAARFATVEVTEMMTVERYSHVMHIVSNVRGKLAPGGTAYDVMRSTFPAGTVSGSPKVRAVQIIYELEKNKRGAYAGAVGHFGFDGNLDSCIALRTCVVKDGFAYIQAGAGVVADSDPAREYEETLNKAKAVLRAVEYAAAMEADSAD